jgi:hypothetical protein
MTLIPETEAGPKNKLRNGKCKQEKRALDIVRETYWQLNLQFLSAGY